MAQRTCTLDGCGRKHVARGLCSTHYNQTKPDRHRRYVITCEGCGVEHETPRKDGRYCSLLCRDYVKWGPRFSPWPRAQARLPVLYVRPSWTPVHTTSKATWVSGPCGWCGDQFTSYTFADLVRFCSRPCSRRAARARRRAREAGATGSYTWAEVTRKWLDNGKRCTYCGEARRNDEIEPDHVVPLSKGGSNSIVNVVPACKFCNSDKRDLLLDEWALDRSRRGLEPRLLAA